MRIEKKWEELSEHLRALLLERVFHVDTRGTPILIVADFDGQTIGDTIDRFGLASVVGMGGCGPLQPHNIEAAIKADLDQVGRVEKWRNVSPQVRPHIQRELGFEDGNFPNFIELVFTQGNLLLRS